MADHACFSGQLGQKCHSSIPGRTTSSAIRTDEERSNAFEIDLPQFVRFARTDRRHSRQICIRCARDPNSGLLRAGMHQRQEQSRFEVWIFFLFGLYGPLSDEGTRWFGLILLCCKRGRGRVHGPVRIRILPTRTDLQRSAACPGSAWLLPRKSEARSSPRFRVFEASNSPNSSSFVSFMASRARLFWGFGEKPSVGDRFFERFVFDMAVLPTPPLNSQKRCAREVPR